MVKLVDTSGLGSDSYFRLWVQVPFLINKNTLQKRNKN